MTPQEANPAGHGRPPRPPSMSPGPDDRRRAYGRRVGDRFPAYPPNRAVELAKGLTAIALAAFVVVLLVMLAIRLSLAMFGG